MSAEVFLGAVVALVGAGFFLPDVWRWLMSWKVER